MAKLFAAGTGVMQAFVGETLLFSANTLTESSVEITSAVEEIRGGKGNGLIGRYFHDSNFALNATDALFNLDYLALAFGTQIAQANVETLATETITVTSPNQVTVVGQPVDFAGRGTVGWYKRVKDDAWTGITFSGQSAVATGLTVGESVCVMYNSINTAGREIIVPANIIPSEVHVILKQDLMIGEQSDISSFSKAGELIIEIPRFQLNADQTISMSASGASTTSLSGVANIVLTGGCDNEGYYAKIKEVVYGRQFYEGFVDLAISGGTLKQGDFVVVRGIRNNGASIVAPTNIAYTVTPSSNATINQNTGEITTVSGECTLKAKIKDGEKVIPTPYDSLEAIALIVAN